MLAWQAIALAAPETIPLRLTNGGKPSSSQSFARADLRSDWHDASGIRFEIRRREPVKQKVWVYGSLEVRPGLWFQTTPLRLKRDDPWQKMEWHFKYDQTDWMAAGHGRVLDDYALARAVSLQLKCSAANPELERFEIRNVMLRRQRNANAEFKIFDLTPPHEGIAVGDYGEIKFRMNRPYRNPFSPAEADVRLLIKGPGGREFESLAFFSIDCDAGTIAGRAGSPASSRKLPAHPAMSLSLRQTGAGYWRAGFRPAVPGGYSCRIQLAGRYTRQSESFSFNVAEKRVSEKTSEPAAIFDYRALLRNKLDRHSATAFVRENGQWRMSDLPWKKGDSRSEEESPRSVDTTTESPRSVDSAFAHWHAPLEWSPTRKGFEGLGRYHIENAWLLERALQRAEARGESFPLRLFATEEFHLTSRNEDYALRWDENPYAKANGGPVNAPSMFFSETSTLYSAQRLLRYVYARYGHYSSLSHVVLGFDFAVPVGAADWHRRIGDFWDALPKTGAHRPTLVSLHPQAGGGSATREVTLQTEPTQGKESHRFSGPAFSDWSVFDGIAFDLKLPADAPEGMQAMIQLRDDGGWWYQHIFPGFLRSGDFNRLYLNLGQHCPLQPAGHSRPWNAYTRMALRKPELLLFSPEPRPDEIPINQPPAINVPRAMLIQLPGGNQPGRTWLRSHRRRQALFGETTEIVMQLTRAYSNPFEPLLVKLEAKVMLPDDRFETRPAFFYQAFEEREIEGKTKLVPTGAPEWRIRIPTSKPGRYAYRIFLSEDGEEPTELLSDGFHVEASETVADGRSELSDSARSLLVETPDRFSQTVSALIGGKWTPPALPEPDDESGQLAPQKLWLANLEWNREWGEGYLGLGKLNQLLAYRLDRAIAEAESASLAYPLRAIGNEEFHTMSSNINHKYRWKDNPLNQRNGGPLQRPSQYFSHVQSIHRFRSLARYLNARYGASKAVKGIVLANDMPEPGVWEWNQIVALSLSGLPPFRNGHVITWHPLTGSKKHKLRSVPGPFEEVHRSADAPRQPSSLVAERQDHAEKISSARVFTCENVKPDWSRHHLARATFALPTDAPGGMRVMMTLKDEDGWWYQLLHPSFLRPDDTTFLLFDLRPGGGLSPVGHERPWTPYSRYRVSNLQFRVFSSEPYEEKLQLTRLDFLELPATHWPLRAFAVKGQGRLKRNEMFEAAFRLNQSFRNPFDPAEADISATFIAPSGKKQRVNAFFTQDYEIDETLIPTGRPHWKVRYRPAEEGKHYYRLFSRSKGEEEPLHREDSFTVEPPSSAISHQPSATPTPSDFPSLQTIHDLSYGMQAEYVDGNWKERSRLATNEIPLWQPVLEWTSRWGKYKDLGLYNLEEGWQLDEQLKAAAAKGLAIPLRLNGNMEFFNRRKHRWPDNPLNKINGGPIASPSLYYKSAEALQAQRQLWRYLIARYGHMPAVSGFVLAADMGANGAEAWHARAGGELGPMMPAGKRLFSLHPQALKHEKKTILADFEGQKRPRTFRERNGPRTQQGIERFRQERSIEGGNETRLSVSDAWASSGRHSLAVRRNFMGEGEAPFVADIDQDWFDYNRLVFDVKLPEEAPHDMRVMVFLKDGDFWMYQNLLNPLLIPGDVTRLIVDITSAEKAWSPPPAVEGKEDPWRHSKPWTDTARSRIRQIGFRIFAHEAYGKPIYIDNLQLWRTQGMGPEGEPRITQTVVNRKQVPVFERFELSFLLDREFRNPFNTEEIDMRAMLIGPAGILRVVPAFYFQDYERREVKQFCREHRDEELFEILAPKGTPHWKVRFTPTVPGTYQYLITINGRRAWPAEGEASFTAVRSKTPGFVRVAKDRVHFEHSTGQFYYPIGHNLRSPTDNRNNAAYKGRFTQEWHRGTFLFDDYFKKMKENDCNWARVWQCSWWMGLEWTRAWPGFHGIGRYNMESAWRLDYLLEQARKSGIYLQIDTTNHGQYSTKIDTEWRRNPYNVNNPEDRGPLRRPKEFFTTDTARQLYSRRVRYTAGRWGHSPNVFSWILMTECEFTDDYFHTAYREAEAGTSPMLVRWHEFAAGEFKKWDPNHLVSTHFSHPFRGFDVFDSPSVEYVHSNTYWQNWKFKQLGGPLNDSIWVSLFTFQEFTGTHDKPTLVGEYGGDVKKNRPSQLDIELHIGGWSKVVIPYAGSTGYWWWPWLHYMDRYGEMKAVANFMKGEDRRGKNLQQVTPRVNNGLRCIALQNGTMADLWVFNRRIIFQPMEELDVEENARVQVSDLRDGNYRIEFWNTYEGKRYHQIRARSGDEKLVFNLPKFRGDLAIKVRRE
ncbi:MAG: DUF5060 domain-containing protein [Planctomycetota bacterium]|nr:DUF5060 domain-containing protein [Planctomycetota bacterium]